MSHGVAARGARGPAICAEDIDRAEAKRTEIRLQPADYIVSAGRLCNIDAFVDR